MEQFRPLYRGGHVQHSKHGASNVRTVIAGPTITRTELLLVIVGLTITDILPSIIIVNAIVAPTITKPLLGRIDVNVGPVIVEQA